MRSLRYRVTVFLMPTLGGTVVYYVTIFPWLHGRDRILTERVVLDLTGY